MTLVRWNDPFREWAQWQDRVNRVFSGAQVRSNEGSPASASWIPPVDIYEGGNREFVLRAELPDMSREAIEVTVDNGTLTIRGEKARPTDDKDGQFHRIERQYGAFTRSFALPRTVDTSKVAAEYKNGVLTVRLPQREDARPRQIKVDVAA